VRAVLPSPAMTVALIALGAALGGSAVAGNGLITGSQIKDHSVGLNDLTYTAVATLRGRQGPPGPAGPPATSASIAKKLAIVQATVTVAAGGVGSVTAHCPAGSVILSGGAHSNGQGLWMSSPVAVLGAGTGWQAGGNSYSAFPSQVDATAICLKP
jgi:hypothetical protein